MKVIIAGGGTGGHIFPALSIADEILSRSRENKVLFIGTSKGLEKELIQSKGFDIEYIRSSGIAGKGIFSKLLAIMKSTAGLADSFRILKGFKPDVVIGVGGYVSGPVLLSAKLLSLPTAICEQNSVPGLTNRILCRITDRIFATFEESLEYFKSSKTVVTGNPVRKEILSTEITDHRSSDRITVFITGGSQGASKINRVMPEVFDHLGKKNRVRIIHQSGKNDLKTVGDAYSRLGLDAEVHSFIDDMASAYHRADLVISRAGAGAVSELSALGKPSVLIPYPYAANNHQYFNAKFMEKGGAAVVVEEKDLDHMIFCKIIDKILDRTKLDEMSACALKLARPEATQNIVNEIYSLAKGK